MSQSTLDDDELFGEAASEIRSDVEESLDEAWSELPEADDIWEIEGDNALGTLNALRSALDAGDAADHLRDAKKWFTMGQRAEAFDEEATEELEEEIARVEDLIDDIQTAHEQVGDLASTLPELRSTLEEAGDDDEDDE